MYYSIIFQFSLKKMSFIVLLLVLATFVAESMGADCGAVAITEWGENDLKRKDLLPSPVNVVVIQHTASPDCLSDAECVKIARAVRKHHINKLKFDDIGTSFLVGGNGKVYEGAGWKYVGAHTRGYNTISIGIAFIGDFRAKLPTPEAMDAVKNLLNCGVEQKLLSDKYHLFGHRQLTKTISPGEALQKEIEGWEHWRSDPKDATN